LRPKKETPDVPNRTQVVVMHEGKDGVSIDPIFVNSFLKKYAPEWLRPVGSNKMDKISNSGR
jgi:hypothetical protein